MDYLNLTIMVKFRFFKQKENNMDLNYIKTTGDASG